MRIERRAFVEAPPTAVFAVIADPATHVEWRPSAVEFRALEEGPVGIGSTLVETVRFLGRRYRSTYVVSELEPARAFAVRTLAGPVPLELRCLLEPLGAGTEITFVLDAEPPRGSGRLLRLILRWSLSDEARRLKRLVERGRSTA